MRLSQGFGSRTVSNQLAARIAPRRYRRVCLLLMIGESNQTPSCISSSPKNRPRAGQNGKFLGRRSKENQGNDLDIRPCLFEASYDFVVFVLLRSHPSVTGWGISEWNCLDNNCGYRSRSRGNRMLQACQARPLGSPH